MFQFNEIILIKICLTETCFKINQEDMAEDLSPSISVPYSILYDKICSIGISPLLVHLIYVLYFNSIAARSDKVSALSNLLNEPV
ncbi:hypothetical protein HZS_7069 [Henneguya salminicola]|nr:hypothetical protein HZS_7069 [Henneguya salminicola]